MCRMHWDLNINNESPQTKKTEPGCSSNKLHYANIYLNYITELIYKRSSQWVLHLCQEVQLWPPVPHCNSIRGFVFDVWSICLHQINWNLEANFCTGHKCVNELENKNKMGEKKHKEQKQRVLFFFQVAWCRVQKERRKNGFQKTFVKLLFSLFDHIQRCDEGFGKKKKET